jgi:hypothetical protein
MGILICGFVLGSAWVFWLSTKKKTALACISLVLCFGLPLVCGLTIFQEHVPTEMQTVELKVADDQDFIYSQEKIWNMNGKKVNVKVTYELEGDVEEDIYLFKDSENFYYVRDEKVFVTALNNVLTNVANNTAQFDVEIVKGDFEKPYLEKYTTEVKNTFLSLGGYEKVEYKFYIPNNLINE